MSLQAGRKAPYFTGLTQDGTSIALDQFKGKKLLLYFYPKDNTPGCTKQACNLRDNDPLLREKGFAIVGISSDSVASHQRFSSKYALPFPLIADKDGVIAKAYEVGPALSFPKRTTFIIDEKGYISKIISPVKASAHAEQILAEEE